VQNAVSAEYGSSAVSTNIFWRARNISEYILEHHSYGNVSCDGTSATAYHPASCKWEAAIDTDNSDNYLSCSSSTFTLLGMLRYLGVPSRWIATTKQRGDWDANADGYMRDGESALDESYHRWAEVYLGSSYGWQRFDPTPSEDGPRDFSQYELMSKMAAGVGTSEVIMHVGSAYLDAFALPDGGSLRYNQMARFDTTDWDHGTYAHIEWSNPCSISLSSPIFLVMGDSAQVEWTAAGRWDLDPSATVSIMLQTMEYVDSEYVESGDAEVLAEGIAYNAGSYEANLAGHASGVYRIEIVKDGDSQTGAEGYLFAYLP
jgi:hypothetical protein